MAGFVGGVGMLLKWLWDEGWDTITDVTSRLYNAIKSAVQSVMDLFDNGMAKLGEWVGVARNWLRWLGWLLLLLLLFLLYRSLKR